jgi:hypothetical protein
MSSSINDTEIALARQGADWNEEEWQRQLSERLPSDWQEQAINKKAWQRTRKLAHVQDLLRGLLVYVACGYSFRQLGIWATLVGLGSLSERAWRKRVQRAGDWIAWLMGALIGTQQAPAWLGQTVGRVLLIDGTRLGVPAGTGDDARLHSAYDLRAGRLVHVEVTDRHSAEGLHHFNLCAADITVTDTGYQVGACVQQGQAHGAFGVHRVSDHQVRFEREDGKKINLKRLVKHQGYGTVTQRKVWVWDPKHQQRIQVRLVIETLPRKQAMQARERKRKRIRLKHGPKHSMASAWWSGVLLLATTLPEAQWSAQEVVKLYRARWQIELLFKRLKQGLQLHLLPVKLWERARVYVHLCLVLWSLQEQEAQLLHEQLSDLLIEPEVGRMLEQAEEELQEPMWVISRWGLMRCELDTLRTLLHGSWPPHRLQQCLPQLRRYLVTRQRKKRISQETEVRAWLSQRLAKPTKQGAAA